MYSDLSDHSKFIYDRFFYTEKNDQTRLRNKFDHQTWTIQKIVSLIKSNPFIKKNLKTIKMHLKGIILDSYVNFGSASSSKCKGIISINCKNNFQDEDIVEMILHELVHNIGFLDHLNHGLIKHNSDIKIYSPLRKEYRPIALSIHALLVCIELIFYRYKNKSENLDYETKIHPSTKELILHSSKTISDLNNHLILLNPRGRFIVKKSYLLLKKLIQGN